jgi:FlaA1/EpsC-like NDP-sugar epimerase
MWVAVFKALGLYSPEHLSGFEEFRRAVSAVCIGIVFLILMNFWVGRYLSRSWMALTLVIALVLEVSVRRAVRDRVNSLHERGSLALRTLVLGSGRPPTGLMHALNRPGSGYWPVGYIDLIAPVSRADGAPEDHYVQRLRTVLRTSTAECVFVTSASMAAEEMAPVIHAVQQERLPMHLYTPLSGILTSRIIVQPVGDQGVALTLKPARLTRTQRLIKRAFDLTFALLALTAARASAAAIIAKGVS